MARKEKGDLDVDAPGGDRITTLADGVFAIVMTLLVLGIEVPRVTSESLDERLVGEVLRLWPRIVSFVVSFLVLGIYWIGHHTQFRFVRAVDRAALWINIVFFMGVSLVPFTTKLVGEYGTEGIALWLYVANLTAISLLLLAHWRYLARADLLKKEVDAELIRTGTIQILVGPAIYMAALAISFIDTRLALLVVLLAPVLHILPGPIHVHWSR